MDDKNPKGLKNLLTSSEDRGARNKASFSDAASKKPEDLVEEEIDSQVLSILGLEDVFDLTYEEYATLLKEAAVRGRMANSQMTTESVELVTNELKRVKGKTGRFKVKQKKINIDKVLDRKTPSDSSAMVNYQKLLPPTLEKEETDIVKTKTSQDEIQIGIQNILTSLITVRGLLEGQSKSDQETAKVERKKSERTKKRDREDALEKKKEDEFKLPKVISTPIDNFFESIKRYFKNILLGSVVLGLYKWLKNPANEKTINDFGNFLTNNAPLILGGLLAIAALPIASTLLGLTGAVLGGIPTLIGALGFLATPAGLAALAVAAGVTAAKTLQDVVRPKLQKLVGGESVTKSGLKFRYEDIVSLRNKAYDFMVNAGAPAEEVNKQMKPYEDLMATMRYKKKINDELVDVRKNLKKREEEYKGLGGDKVDTPINRTLKAEIERLKEFEKAKIKEKERASTSIKERFDKIGVGEDALEKAITARKGTVERLGQPTVQPQTPAVPGASSTRSGPDPNATFRSPNKSKFSSFFGSKESFRKKAHEGIDDPIQSGTSLSFNQSGKIVDVYRTSSTSRESGGGYGQFVKVQLDDGKVLLMAHLSEISSWVKNGVKFNANEIIAKSGGVPGAPGSGRSGGAHLHFEQHNTPGLGLEETLRGKVDPIAGGGIAALQYGGIDKTGKVEMDSSKTTRGQVTSSAQIARTPAPTPSIPSPTGRSNIVPLPIPTQTQQASQSNSAPLQTPVPFFSSEDPNNMTTLVVKAIYNVVG